MSTAIMIFNKILTDFSTKRRKALKKVFLFFVMKKMKKYSKIIFICFDIFLFIRIFWQTSTAALPEQKLQSKIIYFALKFEFLTVNS